MSGTMGQSIAIWESINAELMLFVFLPPLVFGEAMSLNWYHLKGGLLQALILAGPGVLIGAALVLSPIPFPSPFYLSSHYHIYIILSPSDQYFACAVHMSSFQP